MSHRLFRLQRYSAIALVPFVLAHLVLIFWVGAAGLTAQQVLSRTHNSVGWAAFYGSFVVLIALHGSVGLWQLGKLVSGGKAWIAATLALLFACITMALGLRAILGLYAATPTG